jgi:hypothetical protein
MEEQTANGKHGPSLTGKELLALDSGRTANLRLIKRAARWGWPVPKDVQEHAVSIVASKLDSDDERVSIAAAKALVDMVGQNIKIDMAEDAQDEPKQSGVQVVIIQPPRPARE